MEQLEPYRNFLASTLYLTLGAMVAVYAYFIAPDQLRRADVSELSRILNQENQRIEADNAAEREEVSDAEDEVGIRSIPAFLQHINKIAQDTDVIIRELLPGDGISRPAGGELKYRISITTDYLTFLRFAAGLESLSVGINDLQVRPYDASQTPAVHAISFSITPRDDGRRLEHARIDTMLEKVGAKNKRNPFQRYAFNESEPKPNPWIDLTWIHKLSGTGMIGDVRAATINGREYAVGDMLKDMVVSEIRSDRVMLSKETANGEQIYVIGYRKQRNARAG